MSETSPAAAPVPPGWYDDGTGSGRQRWWSGVDWTDHVAGPAAGGASGAVPVTRPVLPADRPVYGVWIWLIVLLPLLVYPLFFLWQPDFASLSDPSSLNDPVKTQSVIMSSVFSPGYFAILLSGWILYGLTAVFAWRDVVWLRAQGVVRPFPWPWVFLYSPVYIIGRSVIVRRVAAPRGLAPIWVFIGVIVVGFIVGAVYSLSLVSGLLSHLPDTSTYSSS